MIRHGNSEPPNLITPRPIASMVPADPDDSYATRAFPISHHRRGGLTFAVFYSCQFPTLSLDFS